jgi:hypothetical protein
MSATLDAATIRRLADMHAVYRLFDEAGTLLYVGMSGRTGRRFDDHAVKNWWPLVRTITLEWHDTKAQADLAERRAISTERPRYNKAGLKPAAAISQQQAHERKRRAAEEKQRAIEERRQLIAERKQALAEEKRQIAEEEQRIADEKARLMREMPPRDLLADLDMVMGDHRVNTRDVAAALRALAPEWEPYRKMTGVRLREELKRKGARTINTSGRHYLDPADLRRVRVGGASMRNSA